MTLLPLALSNLASVDEIEIHLLGWVGRPYPVDSTRGIITGIHQVCVLRDADPDLVLYHVMAIVQVEPFDEPRITNTPFEEREHTPHE